MSQEAHPKSVVIPIAGRSKDSEWYLSNHMVEDHHVTIEVVLDRTGESLVIYDPVSAYEYLKNHCEENDLIPRG